VDRAARVPQGDLASVVDAQGRFEAQPVGLDDERARAPTLLPGWSVGHVLTHLARNADSHVRRTAAACRGEVVDQYPGGREGRDRDIESGAGRPASQLVADVVLSAERLRSAWSDVPDTAWSAVTRDVSGRERPLQELPARRWQELEVHLVDLNIGISHRDWPPDFVSNWLPRLRQSLPARLPPGWRPPDPAALDERDELAWLYGRLAQDDLPPLAPWG
jgi:maleylpyruvate isomerase